MAKQSQFHLKQNAQHATNGLLLAQDINIGWKMAQRKLQTSAFSQMNKFNRLQVLEVLKKLMEAMKVKNMFTPYKADFRRVRMVFGRSMAK